MASVFLIILEVIGVILLIAVVALVTIAIILTVQIRRLALDSGRSVSRAVQQVALQARRQVKTIGTRKWRGGSHGKSSKNK